MIDSEGIRVAKFPSEAWIQLFKEKVNSNAEYAEAAKNWEGDFQFIVTPDEALDREMIFYVDLWHGKCREVSILRSREERKTAFTWRGTYSNWKRLISEKRDPIRDLLTRKFQLEGDMIRIMRAVRAAQELVKTAASVPTEFV